MGGHSLLRRERRPGAAGEAVMPNKKKYNVNGDSGMKAQVRALCRIIIIVFLLKNAFVSLLSLFSSSFPRRFHPIAYSWSPPVGEIPDLRRGSLRFLSGVMDEALSRTRCSGVVLRSTAMEESVGLMQGSFPGKPWITGPFLRGDVAQGGSV